MRSGRLHGVVLVPAILILAHVLQQGATPPAPAAPRIPAAPAAATPTQPAAKPTPAPPLTVPAPAAGPSAVLDGKLVDDSTGKPVQGAKVLLPELGVEALSATDGSWSFPAVPVRHKAYEVLITCQGYAAYSVVVRFKPAASKLTIPTLRLKPKGW